MLKKRSYYFSVNFESAILLLIIVLFNYRIFSVLMKAFSNAENVQVQLQIII